MGWEISVTALQVQFVNSTCTEWSSWVQDFVLSAQGEDSGSHLQRSRELGKEVVFREVAFTQGFADFAMASPLLVWAPPWADMF